MTHLVRVGSMRCVVPIYPLGGVLGADRTVSIATDLAADLLAQPDAEGLHMMGDSAGGGLAVAQALRDRERKASGVVLISPWLDLATAAPDQHTFADRGAMLAAPGLVEAGRLYARDMACLPPITAFTGTNDLLNPDSHRLRDACHLAGAPCRIIEAPGMPHAYPLLPTPEGRSARRRILDLIL